AGKCRRAGFLDPGRAFDARALSGGSPIGRAALRVGINEDDFLLRFAGGDGDMHRQRRFATPTFLTEKRDGAHNVPLTVLPYGCVDVWIYTSMDVRFFRSCTSSVRVNTRGLRGDCHKSKKAERRGLSGLPGGPLIPGDALDAGRVDVRRLLRPPFLAASSPCG